MFDGLTYSWQDGKSCMINSTTENSTAEFTTDTQTFYPLAELLVFSWQTLTVCCISMFFAYGFRSLPIGFQKVTF